MDSVLEKLRKGETSKLNRASEEGKAVIRHLGGWAVHAVVGEFNKYIMANMSSKSPAVQTKVSCYVQLRRNVLDSLTISALDIHRTTSYVFSLQHTDYYSRGNLTYINDDCYNFFLDLEQKLEDYLQVLYLVQNGQQFVYKATNSLFDDDTLKSFFLNLLSASSNGQDQTYSATVSNDEVTVDSKTTDSDEYGVDQSDIIEFDDNFDVADSLEFFNFSFISDPAQVDGNDSNVSSINGSESSTGIVNNHLTDNLLTQSTADQSSETITPESHPANNFDLTNNANDILSSLPSDYSSPQDTDHLSLLYRKIVWKYFMCRCKNFLKVLRNENLIKRTVAHRKKVQQRSEKASIKKSKLSIAEMISDVSNGKENSRKVLQGHIASNSEYLSAYTKSELHSILAAYSVPFKKSSNKSVLCQQLKQAIMKDDCNSMPSPDALQAQDGSGTSARGEKRTAEVLE